MLRYQRGYVSLHLQMQKSVSVCYSEEMKRRKTISMVQNLLLVEDLEFTTECRVRRKHQRLTGKGTSSTLS
jgi:hypothetical protein